MVKKHVAQSGAKAGQWVTCSAKIQCKLHNSTHIEAPVLYTVKRWLKWGDETHDPSAVSTPIGLITQAQIDEFRDLYPDYNDYTPPGRRKGSGERQGHGLKYEENLDGRFYLLPYSDIRSYTAEFDRKAINGKPISIKTKGLGGGIELGDYFRNARKSADFYMIASFWQGTKGNIVQEHFLEVPVEEWLKNFHDSWEERIRNMFAQTSHDPSYDEEWTRQRTALQNDYEKWRADTGGIIRLNPKRDHSSQLRMQCSIGYTDFLAFADKYRTTDFDKWKRPGK